jgi:electron transfer flavoprotein beta subunit
VNIVVLTKFVPERAGRPPEIGPDFRLRRKSGDGGLDCVDEPGLAIARGLADAVEGTVTALSMGPERAVIALNRALATGADRAILVTDDAVRGADALATARVLACAIERQTAVGYDVIECPLPALVTVTAGVAEPRYPSAKQMIQARRKPMMRWSLADLGMDPELAGPTQEVTATSSGARGKAAKWSRIPPRRRPASCSC